jgi:hypothetical protein
MVRSVKLLLAAFVAALLGTAAFAPAQAAGIPVGSGVTIDSASKLDLTEVRHHRVYRHRAHYGRPVYRHRAYYGRPVYRHRVYYGRPVYRPRVYFGPSFYFPAAPVYRRCVWRPRWVWTPHGYVRRHVRVCRY